MNTPDSPDLLDETIDELFTSQPLKPSANFTKRVLTATNELATRKNAPKTSRSWLWLALPIAALLVTAFVTAQLISNKSVESDSPTLSTIELQEIFILEEGLTGLVDLQEDDLSSNNLLSTFIFFNSET